LKSLNFTKILYVCVISVCVLFLHYTNTLAYENELKSIASNIALKIEKLGDKRVAVVDFTDIQGNVTELGRFIAEELSVNLVNTGKGLNVLDRIHLSALLKEHKLSITGLINPSTAAKLGKLTGVNTLITGTITPFSDSVRLNFKVLELATAKILAAKQANIPMTKIIEELLEKTIDTGNNFVQQPNPSTNLTSNRGQQKKTVGSFVITLDKILIIKGEIRAILNFYNKSDGLIQIKRDTNPYPNLSDELGNSFDYEKSTFGNSIALNPKSNTNIIIYFKKDLTVEQVGKIFSLIVPFRFYPSNDDFSTHYASINFTQITPQKLK
jgi:curli biogenesis system outer membrane secretion channel CsgG